MDDRRPRKLDFGLILVDRDVGWVGKFLAFLVAGPLNPSLVFWLPFSQYGSFIEPEGVLWFVVVPSTIAAASGILLLTYSDMTTFLIVKLAFKVLFWVALIASLPFILFAFMAPPILVFVFGAIVIFGFPAALSGAIVFRLLLFRWRPTGLRRNLSEKHCT